MIQTLGFPLPHFIGYYFSVLSASLIPFILPLRYGNLKAKSWALFSFYSIVLSFISMVLINIYMLVVPFFFFKLMLRTLTFRPTEPTSYSKFPYRLLKGTSDATWPKLKTRFSSSFTYPSKWHQPMHLLA